MALAAALTVLMAFLSAGPASENGSKSLKVICQEDGASQQETVTAANTVLTVVCPKSWTIHPPVRRPQQVCETAACPEPVLLTDYSRSAVAIEDPKPGMTITFKDLPKTRETFHLQCKKSNPEEVCDVAVTLNAPLTGPPGQDRPPQSPPPDSGTPSVQTCKQENASITLKIPEKGSSALFACDTGFDLYPKEANKVFSEDCKKEETLSDMIRTDTPPAGDANGARSEESKTYTYTLKADKKPSKKTLCYLCARHEVKPPGTAKDYCTIYVESGTRTRSDLISTFILALTCVLAAFHLLEYARA